MEEELPVSNSISEDELDILDPSDDVLEEETETQTTGTETDKETGFSRQYQPPLIANRAFLKGFSHGGSKGSLAALLIFKKRP